MGTMTAPDLRIYPNPQTGPAEITLKRGLNLSDNLLEMDREDASLLKNMMWVRKTLQRRKGFRLLSTEDWSAITKWRGAAEYVDRWGNSRKLLGTDTGKVVEYQSASAHSDLITGLGTQQEIRFAQALGAVFVQNGQDTMRRLDGASSAATPCTARVAGAPAALTLTSVAAGAAGVRTGTYIGMVTAVREESGIKVLESDWSNVASVDLSAQKLVWNWSATVDSRVTHYYLYATTASGSVMYYVGKVAIGTTTYTDDTTDASLVGNRPSAIRYRNGEAPVGKYVVFAGGRLVVLNLSSAQNAFQCGAAGIDSYMVENFPIYDTVNAKLFQGGNHVIVCPGNGAITAAKAVGETGDKSARANNLFVAQAGSCYLLPDTNPNNPLQEISSQIGCISDLAIAQYGNGLFFQSRRGVEFWPGNGQTIYRVSEAVTPIFDGGGNQSLTANTSDAEVKYTVWRDTLLITIKDDSTRACANKVYCLDLSKFMDEFNGFAGPGAPEGKALARFSGPWQNNGFGYLLSCANNDLILLDNEDLTLLQMSTTLYQDWVGGANVTADLRIISGPVLKEFKMARNKLHYLDLFAFSNTNSSLRLFGENGAYDQDGITIEAISYDFNWADISWDDITWQYDTWHAEVCLPWSAVAHWFQLDITNTDSAGDFVFYGYALRYSSALRTRTFR